MKSEQKLMQRILLLENGDTLSIIEYGSEEKPWSWKTFTYDKQGRLSYVTARIDADPDAYFEWVYAYDRNGYQIGRKHRSHNSNHVEVLWKEIYVYNAGRLVSLQRQEGKLLTKTDTFTYDDHGYLIRHQVSEDPGKPTFTYIYTRNANGLPLKRETFILQAKKQTPYSTESWDYDWW